MRVLTHGHTARTDFEEVTARLTTQGVCLQISCAQSVTDRTEWGEEQPQSSGGLTSLFSERKLNESRRMSAATPP